mmetsp:Transcript_1585/g.2610  ORF Transcript_1585/g.2610 Transcript_1585/m.2610 type:complete len:314 (-) Transcript_1585:1318-2259(-)
MLEGVDDGNGLVLKHLVPLLDDARGMNNKLVISVPLAHQARVDFVVIVYFSLQHTHREDLHVSSHIQSVGHEVVFKAPLVVKRDALASRLRTLSAVRILQGQEVIEKVHRPVALLPYHHPRVDGGRGPRAWCVLPVRVNHDVDVFPDRRYRISHIKIKFLHHRIRVNPHDVVEVSKLPSHDLVTIPVACELRLVQDPLFEGLVLDAVALTVQLVDFRGDGKAVLCLLPVPPLDHEYSFGESFDCAGVCAVPACRRDAADTRRHWLPRVLERDHQSVELVIQFGIVGRLRLVANVKNSSRRVGLGAQDHEPGIK